MPLWINAADAVLVTSDYEGFGMAAVEALACDVPVLSTDGRHRPLRPARDRRLPLRPLRRRPPGRRSRGAHLEAADPRVAGASRAATLSAAGMAERVIEAYRAVLGDW